ncbi:aminotransferase class V-fold PLP-dependent enzyme [Oscillatoria sp. CS-180]|uniref:aminotransferase class V-fold PLP-dependent enzyme n=1 Tax=Oscillatoria sp. CS-180 TaxID=3021720 RepID=UPI00232F46CB|nr:aminotransferase class V-fold PLP-dependent enzyme [Oscillatoria sp. CS-180]MDB9528430.1 aminotransferase class V-fold PLP-dependent enzyme [Oscillatoria sp. CS-180]
MVLSSPSETDARLQQFRQQFPALVNKRYFNFGGQGPLPQCALDALQQAQLKIQREGPFSGAVNQWLQQAGTEMRQALANVLQVPGDTMTLTESVTVGCNIPLWGIDWRPGDRILLTDCEHPGIVATVQEISRRFQVAVDVCSVLATAQEGDPVAAIAAALQPRTRLLVVSHILWNTGQVLPLADIVRLCHDHTPDPAWVLVDAAQSVGMMPLSLSDTEVDFYAFTGHKWCCGPAGLGGLYVRPEMRQAIAPTFIGWRSITTDAHANPTGWQPTGQRYEVATSDYPLMAGLQAALSLHQTWGSSGDRYQRICTLGRQLWQQLATHPRIRMICAEPPESGLVSFEILDSTETPSRECHVRLVKDLEADGMMLRTLLDPHCVRACVHYLTLEAEVGELSDRIFRWIQNNG